jgi:hypothetical protein
MPAQKDDAAPTAREVAEQIGQQVSQQIAEQVAQAVAQGVNKLMQQTGATSVTSEKEIGETGFSERYQVEGGDRSGLMFTNQKVASDRHQRFLATLEEETQRHLAAERAYVNELRQDSREHLGRIMALRDVSFKGLLTSDALITKQAIAHRDVAIDSTWVPGPGEEKPPAEAEAKTQATKQK